MLLKRSETASTISTEAGSITTSDKKSRKNVGIDSLKSTAKSGAHWLEQGRQIARGERELGLEVDGDSSNALGSLKIPGMASSVSLMAAYKQGAEPDSQTASEGAYICNISSEFCADPLSSLFRPMSFSPGHTIRWTFRSTFCLSRQTQSRNQGRPNRYRGHSVASLGYPRSHQDGEKVIDRSSLIGFYRRNVEKGDDCVSFCSESGSGFQSHIGFHVMTIHFEHNSVRTFVLRDNMLHFVLPTCCVWPRTFTRSSARRRAPSKRP